MILPAGLTDYRALGWPALPLTPGRKVPAAANGVWDQPPKDWHGWSLKVMAVPGALVPTAPGGPLAAFSFVLKRR